MPTETDTHQRVPTPKRDLLIEEIRALRADIRAHNEGAQKRHESLMKSLTGQSKVIEEIAYDKNRWWAEIKKAVGWLGPTLWEMIRVPAGALLMGSLLLALSRILGVAPGDLLSALGPVPIPVQQVHQ